MGAILVLGMHRSGTSCVAAMLVAAGARVPGEAVRNWDNPRGHHEANALVRLNEDVLAHSGGHWLAAPPSVRWTDAHAAERDRLLSEDAALLKDPRTLLVLPFWAASRVGHGRLGVVRHPLAVARSLLAWRGVAIDEGLRLWLAHARPLLDAGVDVIQFDRPREDVVAGVVRAARGFGLGGDDGVIAAAYADELVHHGAGDGPTGDRGLLAEALGVYAACGGGEASRSAFPWAEVSAAIRALEARDVDGAAVAARAALRAAGDPIAVAAPLTSAFLRRHQGERLLAVLDEVTLPPAVDGLLRGKAHLDAKHWADAVKHLRAACEAPEPLYEARHLLPVALHGNRDRREADRMLAELLPAAIYPFRVHARRAEWAWTRNDREVALQHLDAAIAAAPARRQGRLLHRRAAWKRILGDLDGAEADLALARERDPAYSRQ
jgi:hypothetical protein